MYYPVYLKKSAEKELDRLPTEVHNRIGHPCLWLMVGAINPLRCRIKNKNCFFTIFY